MKKKVLIDCDPGHDDMIAIMLACCSKEIEVLGITTVAGNQTGDKTYLNAHKVLKLINREDLRIARGYDFPLFKKLVTAPEIHGVSGLDGAALPEIYIKTKPEHALDFIISTLMSSQEKVWLIPTGPLTNIASSLLKEPLIKEKIEKIVLMGGAVCDSNITPSAEFNIFVDPEAARIVFESGLPITMVGLDVTNKALFTFEYIDLLDSFGGKVSAVVAPLLKFFARTNLEIFSFPGAPLHDALAVAYVIDPTVLTTKYWNVKIETKGEFTSGRTVVDVYNITGDKPNAEVAMEIDLPKFKNMIFNMIKHYDGLACNHIL